MQTLLGKYIACCCFSPGIPIPMCLVGALHCAKGPPASPWLHPGLGQGLGPAATAGKAAAAHSGAERCRCERGRPAAAGGWLSRGQ